MRRGFTLIEVLVVVAIIALLAGLVLGSVSLLRHQARKHRSLAAIQLVQQAVETHRANRGGTVALAEHPLAGSRVGGGAFLRAGGGTVNVSGIPLVCAGISGLAAATRTTAGLGPAEQARLLLEDDRYADPGVAAFYGLRRDAMGVLGLPLPDVTRHIRLALETSGRDAATGVADAWTLPKQLINGRPEVRGVLVKPGYRTHGRVVTTSYADSLAEQEARGETGGDRPAPEFASPEARRKAMRESLAYIIAVGGNEAELVRLGALHEAPDDDDANLALDRRVWSPGLGAGLAAPCREIAPGGVRMRYRLRGVGLYDAWGHEILARLDPQGGLELVSSGRDGCFAIDPGPDKSFATAATDASPVGNDRDATIDNVRSGREQR